MSLFWICPLELACSNKIPILEIKIINDNGKERGTIDDKKEEISLEKDDFQNDISYLVDKIIRTFRFYMLPELPKDKRFGRFFVTPAEFIGSPSSFSPKKNIRVKLSPLL